MNTLFLTKSISPSSVEMSNRLESWFYGLVNSILVGGSTAVVSWMGLAAAKGIGVDVPTLNFKAVGIVFLSGAASKFFLYLSQGLPQLGGNSQAQPSPPDAAQTK